MPASNEILEFVLDTDFEGLKRVLLQSANSAIIKGETLPKLYVEFWVDLEAISKSAVSGATVKTVSHEE
jgi:hypothetical protein